MTGTDSGAARLIDAQDKLAVAAAFVNAIYMAAQTLSADECNAISIVADAALDRLREARSIITACEAGEAR